MESDNADNKEKSLVDEYLNQNSSEANKSINLNSTTLSPASSGKRIGAFLIDRLILFVIISFLSFILKLIQDNNMFPFFISTIVEFMYAGYFYSSHMATPGKMALGLQVVKDSGEKLDFLKAGLRDSIGKTISGVILGIGDLIAFFRSDRCTLHDLIFKTKVVERN